ncbi:MAG: nitrate/nitrite transporter NrtS [Dehalococcoidia bacterium]|nr:nitrate/nitrite transporter NrtS [Dehalococcoidia bacterium]
MAASLVGTILILLNQGDFIFTGDFYKGLIWKVPLTYLVPFCVATWGAVTNCESD